MFEKIISYILSSISTLFACRPPSNLASNHSFTIILANSLPITLDPKASIFVSLCSLDNFAEYGSLHTTALIPFTLFAAIDIPTPVPHITIPQS